MSGTGIQKIVCCDRVAVFCCDFEAEAVLCGACGFVAVSNADSSISFGGCSLVSAAVICFSRSGFFGLLGCCLFWFAGMSVTLVWCFSAREFVVHLVHSRRE